MGDEATKIVLNVTGTKGDISEELKDTLDFIAGKVPQSEYAKDLQAAVEEIKQSKEWRREYMLLFMRDREQQKIGDIRRIITTIRKKMDSESEDYFVDLFDIERSQCQKILFYLNNKPDWDDQEIAEAIINEDEE